MNYRIEKDTMGEMRVQDDKYWAAQTQRSLENFKIGTEKMPKELIYSFAILKRCVAKVNNDLNKLPNDKKEAIFKACDAILESKFDDNFPLSVWQTGSGTQTNMNLNEVIANIATQMLGGNFREKKLVHPNDDVNMSQSSNDTFPTAMHIVSVLELTNRLLPSLKKIYESLLKKENEFKNIIKIGRTHLQDATPLTLGNEFSGYRFMIESNIKQVESSIEFLKQLAIGGTAVGTGLNAHPELSKRVCEELSNFTGVEFISSENKFHALTSHDALTFASGALKALGANLMKIANDIRWLSSGPRCGLGEINIPENEPGSSIMPGKVNPTQCEAVTMVAVQVFGNDAAITFGASQGNFELNVFKPVIIYNFLQSIRLLSDVMDSFRINCIDGITPNADKIGYFLQNSLMLVTALNPYIGYENAAKIAKYAHINKISLKQAAIELKILTEREFDEIVVPEKMV